MTIAARCVSLACVVCVAAIRLAAQQNQPPTPAPPASPAIVEQIDRLKTSVGPRWADAVRFWCEAPRANRPDDPLIQPVKIFDNVYAIDSIGTVAYVILDRLEPTRLVIIEVTQIVLHDGDEPDVLVHLLHSDPLAGKDLADASFRF